MSKKGLTRRELFSFLRRPEEEKPKTLPVLPPGLPWPLRPPGAKSELRFNDLCERCGKCVEACPVHAIAPLPEGYGVLTGTPHLTPRKQPCVLCEDLPCVEACPTGALRFVADVRLGLAAVHPERCVTFQGTFCDDCNRACPVPLTILFNNQGHPRVDRDRCTGCGACEHACPTAEPAITVRSITALSLAPT